MKTTHALLVPCLLIALAGTTTRAQDQYQTTMSTMIYQIDTTKAMVDNMKIANTFERIGDVEKTKWLPYYYAAYYTTLESLQQTDMTKVDVFCDQAEKYLDEADGLSPKNSEVYCMRSMIILSRIRVNQTTRGMGGLVQAQQALESANTFDDKNPRVYFMMGQQAFNTPEVFGGSKENALRYFEQALALLVAQKDREATIDVHWGRSTTEKMVQLCRKKLELAQKSK